MDLNLGSTRALIDECRRQGLLRNQCAYVLATAFWETARTMKPVREMGGEKYLKSKKYYPYVGMGFVQLTWLKNYQLAEKKLGAPFVKNPKLLLDPKYAVPIAVTGMREGWFTGKKLSNYITLAKSDFVNARRIINGTDKAKEIAKLARDYDMDLAVTGYAQKKPASARPAPVVTIPAIEPKPAPAPHVVTDKAIVAITQRRLSELGYNPGGDDGLFGPLTKGAILEFRHDHDLPLGDVIDDELAVALAAAEPRKMVPARANATTSEIASIVPEAKAHSWIKTIAGGGGGTLAIGALTDAVAPAKGYVEQIRDLAPDVPGYVWLGIGALFLIGIAYVAMHGQKKAAEAFRTGDRR